MMLHDIGHDLEQLLLADEWDEAAERAVAAMTVDADEVDVEQTADRLALAFDELRRWQDELREISQAYAARAHAVGARLHYVRGLLLRLLEEEGARTIRTPRAMITRARNARPSVRVADPAALPPELRVAKWAPETDALLTLWRGGEPLPPGVEIEQGEHVRVKLGGAPAWRGGAE